MGNQKQQKQQIILISRVQDVVSSSNNPTIHPQLCGKIRLPANPRGGWEHFPDKPTAPTIRGREKKRKSIHPEASLVQSQQICFIQSKRDRQSQSTHRRAEFQQSCQKMILFRVIHIFQSYFNHFYFYSLISHHLSPLPVLDCPNRCAVAPTYLGSEAGNNNQQNQHIYLSDLVLQMQEQKEEPSRIDMVYPSQLINAQKKVNIYLRLTSKFGKKLMVWDKMSVQDIMKIADAQFSIPVPNQIIFYSSQKFTYNDQRILELYEGAILHLHHAEEYAFDQLKLTFQEVTDQGSTGNGIQYTVDSNKKIIDFLNQKFQSADILLIESGRKLDNSRTFRSQQISNRATIHYIYKQKQLNHDEFEKDFNKLFQQQDSSEEEPKSAPKQDELLAKAREQRQKTLAEIKIKIQQASSSEEMDNFQLQPNFKKKRSICLTAVKKNPEDPNYTWRRETSFSESKNNRKLIKAIRGKKKKQSYSNKFEESSQNSQMSVNAKIKLRQQVNKLFASQNLSQRPSQKKKFNCLAKSERYQNGKAELKQRQILQCQSQMVF